MRIIYFFIFFVSNFYMIADSIYCIKYGESKYKSEYIFFNDKENREIDFDWLFYLVRTKDKNILIDCGFYSNNLIELFKINYKDPINILKNNGVEKERITDIIITHSHFDHIENVIFFENANIYIQEDEFNLFINNRYSNKRVVEFLKNKKNIILFKERYQLKPNIIIKKIGGHSIGSSIVEVYFKEKNFILVSDEMYVRENFYKKIGVGTYFNHKKNIEFIKSLNQIDNILFFHDSLNKKEDFFLVYSD